jgi:three-Cys-motif partner protein
MIKNGVGTSCFTEEKLDTFQAIIKQHIIVSSKVIQKYNYYDRSYWYFDLTAGPGITDGGEGYRGSQLVFLDEAIKHPDIMFNVVLFEINSLNFDQLLYYTDDYRQCKNINLFVEHGDHKALFKKYHSVVGLKRIGLIYCDPSGNVPNFDLLGQISIMRLFTPTDFLVYVSGTNIKRVSMSPSAKETRRLSEYIETVNKKWWQLWEPLGKHQWTFLFGSNYQFQEFKKSRFHYRDSKEGKDIWEKLCKTHKELQGDCDD